MWETIKKFGNLSSLLYIVKQLAFGLMWSYSMHLLGLQDEKINTVFMSIVIIVAAIGVASDNPKWLLQLLRINKKEK